MKESEKKDAVVLVGLPARGKTYIASKLCRYLKWKGYKARIFNTGMYRQQSEEGRSQPQTHIYFDPDNEEMAKKRLTLYNKALDDMIRWLNEDGRVGIYDASNLSRERRAEVFRKLKEEAGADVFFIESVCDDENIIRANIEDVKLSSPDYKDFKAQEAVEDFMKRIDHYKKTYEPINMEKDSEYSFLRLMAVGRQMVTNKVHGYMQTGIVYFLMNIHIVPRTIYISRHGESQYNVLGKIGGDSELSPRGMEYAKKLGAYLKEIDPPDLKVWTSTLIRTIQTAQFTDEKVPQREWRCLEEINAGVCDGYTYEEIEAEFPEDYAQREIDKYNYKYPRGESYHDVVVRLEPVMMELERAHNVLVVGHQAVLRCLLAYFLDKSAEELPYIKIPLHTVLKLTPKVYGCKVEEVPLHVDAVSTYREPSQAALKNIQKLKHDDNLSAEEIRKNCSTE